MVQAIHAANLMSMLCHYVAVFNKPAGFPSLLVLGLNAAKQDKPFPTS